MPQDGLMRMITGGPRIPPQPAPPPPPGFEQPLGAPFMPALEYTAHFAGELVVEALKKYGNARIGIAGGQLMSVGSYQYLTKHLNKAKFENATDLVDYIKVKKSDDELALIRETCRLQDKLFEYGVSITEPGRMAWEIQADIVRKWTEWTTEECAGFQLVADENQVFGDKFHKITKDDHVNLLIEPRGPGGIWCEVARPICFGKASTKMEEMFGLAVEARELFLKNLKPGTDPQLLWRNNNEFLRKHGYQEESRILAHSLGYDMVERPSITPGETMPMPTRLNIAIHPFVKSMAYGWVCDNYFMFDDGKVERLHKTPVKIFVT